MRRVLVVAAFMFVCGALYVTQTYNSLEMHKQLMESQWSQLEKRYSTTASLLPRIVALIGDNLHPGTAQEISCATALFEESSLKVERMRGVIAIEDAIDSLYVEIGGNPGLRGNESVVSALDKLASIESGIGVERIRYNEQARMYNTLVTRLFSAYVANAFGFEPQLIFPGDDPATLAQPYARMEVCVNKSHDEARFGLDGSGLSPTK